MTLTGTVWAPWGPSPIAEGSQNDNGMVTAIAVHPFDSNIVYIGHADGGVWKTFDGGDTWRPLFDRELSLAIGEPMGVAIDPTDADVVYVGTSGRGRVSIQQQAGVFKSTDGGATWVQLGSGYPASNTGNATQLANFLINAIIVDPAQPSSVYLGSSAGVWISNDGGLNWTQVNGAGDARSLVLDRSSPPTARILYAGIAGSGVIQSTDGGTTWTQILSATTPAVATALASVAGTTINQVVLDLAPATSPPAGGGIQVIYVAIAGTNATATTFPDPVGLFKSTDQGATWVQCAGSAPGTTYGGYTLTIAVDPASPGDGTHDILYWGTSGQSRSSDSGSSFSGLSGIHSDTHAWAFFPQPSPAHSIIFCGSDGGLTRSTDNGSTWQPRNSGGLQTALFYNIDIKPDATGSITAGALQDNALETSTGPPGWTTISGGDGWDIVYDGTTPKQLFGTTNSGGPPSTIVTKFTNDGVSSSGVTPWGSTGPEAGYYAAQLAADPSAAGTIYVTSNQNLWQTTNAGSSWRKLTPVSGGFITAVAHVAPTNGNHVVVAGNGQVLVSTNALASTVGPPSGVTFTDITRNLPGRNALRVEFDPNDSTVIYAVLGGIAGFGAPGHVFRTTIGATSWTDISPPGVDVPFGALALDGTDTPTTIYVGCDLGVLRSVDRGATWYVLDNLHFPLVPVTELVICRGAPILRAGTYGRGVWEFTRPSWPSIAVDLEADLEFGVVCNGPQFLTLEVFNVGTGDLIINSVQRVMGSTGFSVSPNPGTPVVVEAGDELSFTVEFTPTTPGTPETATIRIASNDPNAPVVDLLATGTGGTASLETVIADAGNFGNVCLGEFVDRDLVISNRGPCPLSIFDITSSATAFFAPGVTSYPLTVAPGTAIDVPIRFQPTARGPVSATIVIDSDDPASPASVDVSGDAPPPRLVASIANSGDFGDVCRGCFRDELLTLSNAGHCPLTISSITSSAAEFLVPEMLSFPLVIAPGGDLELTLRFEPTQFGPSAGTITINSDDPASPLTFAVSGETPTGTLTVTGSLHFGAVELGHHELRTVAICNTGKCDLHVTKVGFLPPCECRDHRCHHCGHGCGCRCGCGCGSHDHDEHGGRGKHEHGNEHHPDARCEQCCLDFRIISNPFPATVRPGSCLSFVVEYHATCRSESCCELIIECDDPEHPTRKLRAVGHLRNSLGSRLKCWLADELGDLLRERGY